MKTLILVLLALWLVFAVVGAVLEGLFWLMVIGLVAFAVTAVWDGSSCDADPSPRRGAPACRAGAAGSRMS